MLFDDRLATVLRQAATDELAARTQYRQLVDLLGRKAERRDPSLLAAAWLRLDALAEKIAAPRRAAILATPGTRIANPELIFNLVDGDPSVASAALEAATLSETDWNALIPRLPVRARGFLRLRRDLPEGTVALLDQLGVSDRGLPRPADAEADGITADTQPADRPPSTLDDLGIVPVGGRETDADAAAHIAEDAATDGEIGTLVRRIEAFRRARDNNGPTEDAPSLPMEGLAPSPKPPVRGFSFATDADGVIRWAEEGVAPMVVGMALLGTDQTIPRLHDPVFTAWRTQRPVRAARVTLQGAPAIAGDWILDASPRFAQPTGRFYGFAGKLRRPPATEADRPPQQESSEADRLRQLLHELKTPVNAIQGFAEVIQQQLFGPVPHEYRAHAATIAGDSARILAGFDEIDRLARLESGSIEMEVGSSELATVIERLIAQLDSVLTPRMAGFEFSGSVEEALVAVSQAELEMMGWRVMATLAAAIGAGEHCNITMDIHGGHARLACTLPASLAGEDDVFAAPRHNGSALSAGMFGAGFALRLARAEARAAGGDMRCEDDVLMVTLPLLTQKTQPINQAL